MKIKDYFHDPEYLIALILVLAATTSTTIMNSLEYKKVLLNRLKDTLKPLGFKKKGNNFTLSTNDLTYFISIQSSQSSTAEVLKVTVNTEIASSLISRLDETSLPVEHQRHYTRRIGQYFEDNNDKWWIIGSIEYARIASDDINISILNYVIPLFDKIKSTFDLAHIWRAGGYIGLTEKQKNHYLSLIDRVI